ncbi:hypothetical protein [Planctomicrobium sp. SH527]|uniref:hypothetical protein n=1 Tax=Planctomicrobium sp. SH527 TaxID=3448123 RepID=UPI003F5BCDA9
MLRPLATPRGRTPMTISRRQFCTALGTAGLSVMTLPLFAQESKKHQLRVIA